MDAYYHYTTPRKGAKIQQGKWARTTTILYPELFFIILPYHSFLLFLFS